MTNIATFTPAEVETHVVKEARVTLNLSIEQAKVIYIGLWHTNGHYAHDMYRALRDVLQQNGIDTLALMKYQGELTIDVQKLGL